MTSPSRAVVAFATIVVVAVAMAVGYVLVLARQEPATAPAGPSATATSTSPPEVPFIAFRRTSVDDAYGTIGLVPLGEPAAPPSPTELSCERIHMSRFSGVCLQVDRGLETTAKVLLLGPDMSVRHTLETPGIPSRARVSPDGRWAATTTFVSGHSYSSVGFSTQTEIYDVEKGESLGNMEDFDFTYHGEPYDAKDINVWGVTFAPEGTTFYATVMTGGNKYLAHGDIAKRSLEMLDVTVECPSLSPSGKLLAYKSATSPNTWQVRVRNLADESDVVIAESRSVDDQIEWLDEEHVVYGLNREQGATTDVWVAPADGSGKSELLIPAAWSPAVVRAD